MIKIAEKGEYSCCQLEEQDWDAYLLFAENSYEESGITPEERTLGDMVKSFRTSFFAHIPFGLFHGINIIGHAHVILPSTDSKFSVPQINGSYILEPYRGEKLGDLLHEARLEYIHKHTSYDTVQTEIWKKNGTSISVAKRNGFEITEQPATNGGDYFVLQRSIDRQTPNVVSQHAPPILGM